MEFKNYHLETTIIVFVLGKNHEQLLKPAGEIMGGKSTFASLKESINMYLFWCNNYFIQLCVLIAI